MSAANRKHPALKARDIMNEDVICVPLSMTLTNLAALFQQRRISGAPVVDAHGALAGVVSQSDLVRWQMNERGRLHQLPVERDGETPPDVHRVEFFANLDSDDVRRLSESFIEEDYGDGLVTDVYTPMVITARPDASIATLATLMYEKKVHRVLIVHDAEVVGIVSSLDVMGTLRPPKRATQARPALVRG